MTGYLVEACRMMQRLFSEADFGESVPNVFGQPTDENIVVAGRNECGLLIRKAQMHVNAALRANNDNNLHSLAVHMYRLIDLRLSVLESGRVPQPLKGLR